MFVQSQHNILVQVMLVCLLLSGWRGLMNGQEFLGDFDEAVQRAEALVDRLDLVAYFAQRQTAVATVAAARLVVHRRTLQLHAGLEEQQLLQLAAQARVGARHLLHLEENVVVVDGHRCQIGDHILHARSARLLLLLLSLLLLLLLLLSALATASDLVAVAHLVNNDDDDSDQINCHNNTNANTPSTRYINMIMQSN